MNIIPPDPPAPDPERSAPKPTPRATTTRFLRLTPAQDVAPSPARPPSAPLPAALPSSSSSPAPAGSPVLTPPAEKSAPKPGSAKTAEPAPAVARPASGPLPPVSTATASADLPRLAFPQGVPADPPAPAHQPDDRPMRLTTKRLPNVFAAAPSARWSPPAAGSTSALRLIPASVLAAPTEPLVKPAEAPINPVEMPAVPEPPRDEPEAQVEPMQIRRSGVLPVPRLKLRREKKEAEIPAPPEPPVAEPPLPPPRAVEPPAEPAPEPESKPALESQLLEPASPPTRRTAKLSLRRRILSPEPGESLLIDPPGPVEAEPMPPDAEPPVPPMPTAEEPTVHVPQIPEANAPTLAPPYSAVTESRLPAPPFVAAHRLTAPPVPLSRLARTERSPLGRGFWILLLLLILVLIVLFYLFGLTPRIAAGKELDHEQKLSAERIVAFGVARLATPHVVLPLPGTIEASQQAALYARTSGYVKKWYVDIGDQVRAGQLLAVLDTPEVDQQLAQAQAKEAQARADLDIVQSVSQRWDAMAKDKAVAQEDADQKDAASSEARANLAAAHAEVARLADLENFKEIHAPFQGRITYRNIDVGSLVTAGTGTPNSELFRVAQTDPLRVFVDVPESDAPAIQPGVKADLQVTSYPGRVFHGEVVRDAGALSDGSRTLRTEIRVANPDGALLPGAFAEVRLQLLDSAPAVLIPASALIVNSTGTSVALLQDHFGHDVVHDTPVRVGRDFGTEVEILENVHQGDRLVTNPPADLNDGASVTSKPEETATSPSVVAAPTPSPRA